MPETLPAEYEEQSLEVESKHILFGFVIVLSGALLVGSGLIYYREHLKIKRHERLLEAALQIINTLNLGEKICSSQSKTPKTSLP